MLGRRRDLRRVCACLSLSLVGACYVLTVAGLGGIIRGSHCVTYAATHYTQGDCLIREYTQSLLTANTHKKTKTSLTPFNSAVAMLWYSNTHSHTLGRSHIWVYGVMDGVDSHSHSVAHGRIVVNARTTEEHAHTRSVSRLLDF